MPVTQQITLRMTQKEKYRFEVDWSLPTAEHGIIDEPPPLGKGEGPNASRLVAAAVAHCLSSSLLYCLERSHAPSEGIEVTALAEIARNERGRWRLSRVSVTLDPQIPAEHKEAFERCKGLFEDYCVVTEAIRQGVPVDVKWADASQPKS